MMVLWVVGGKVQMLDPGLRRDDSHFGLLKIDRDVNLDTSLN
jgi:hypothetical protein